MTCELCGQEPIMGIHDRRARRGTLRLCEEHATEVSVKLNLWRERR